MSAAPGGGLSRVVARLAFQKRAKRATAPVNRFNNAKTSRDWSIHLLSLRMFLPPAAGGGQDHARIGVGQIDKNGGGSLATPVLPWRCQGLPRRYCCHTGRDIDRRRMILHEAQ